MRKSTLAAVSALTLTLAACGGTNAATTTTEAPTSQEVTEEPTEDPTEEPTDDPTDDPTDEPTDDPTDEPSPEPTPDPAADDRYGPAVMDENGYNVKELGKYGGLKDDETGEVWAEFRVIEIVEDFTCPLPDALEPSKSQYLGVKVEVETGPAESTSTGFPFGILDGEVWLFNEAQTETEYLDVGNSPTCIDDSHKLPREIGPDEKVSGWFVMDTAFESGGIVIDQILYGHSWVWEF